ncbi:hypothetical protein, partial [Campylobacter hyointestinalis]|uniref:hypothetical protein n=1 Tax=Campylobacter hyointestinalis TaxID=198 RepID=UPI000DCDBEFB
QAHNKLLALCAYYLITEPIKKQHLSVSKSKVLYPLKQINQATKHKNLKILEFYRINSVDTFFAFWQF